ncbi:hypothetical protein K1T73_03010 [Roseovarius sp. SCSIO 43702]|uniref:COG4223 family protein n=1 Tax=Roseovarius sp. SCSIO 43702 TaxID=2823043 RepID=UPI001C72B577|nr:hypothetical protein [Roseovarius sp. SCSIO 43702]QYX57387.1 hypothetical protein K1T73_03010 [Roseovarius sp. SCSIO 43702]
MAAKKTKTTRKTTATEAELSPKAAKSANPEPNEPKGSDTPEAEIETAGDTTPPEAKETTASAAPGSGHADAPVGSGDSGLPKKGETDTRPLTYAPATADAGEADGPRTPRDEDTTATPAAPERDRPAAASASPPPAESAGTGFGGFVLGGLLAACIGAVAAYILLPETGLLTRADNGESVAALETRIEEQSSRIAALAEQVSGAETASPDATVDLAPLEGAVSDLSDGLDRMGARMDEIETRLAELESRPTGDGTASGPSSQDVAALRDRLDEQARQLDALMAEAARQEEAAQAAAEATLRRAALTRVETALDTGTPFEAALSDLRDAGQDIPDALSRVAETGVPTLAALQTSFPDAARAALATARREGLGEGQASGFSGFLSSQLGVRSLEPREGSDPDAILSRAEAALREGRLGDALAELESLPEAPRAELSAWMSDATTRLEAINAAASVGAQLN